MRYGNGGSNIEIGKARFHHDGVITEIKQINFGAGGQAVKVYQSGIPVSYSHSFTSDPNSPVLTNLSTQDNLILSVRGVLNAGSTYGYSFYFSFVSPTAVPAESGVLAVNGDFTSEGYGGLYLNLVDFGLLSHSQVNTPNSTQNGNINSTIGTSQSAIAQNENLTFLVQVVLLGYATGSNAGTTFSIPWSAFVWVPTGDQLELA